MNRNLNIAVLGAGIVGINTIIQLQQQFPNAELCLIDEQFSPQTLSYHPAGIFRASPSFGGVSNDIVKQWIDYSFQFYNDLQTNDFEAGILPLNGYIFSNISKDNVKNSLLEEILPEYRDATNEELNIFNNNSWKYGSYFETIRIKCTSFIPRAINRFLASGGRLRKCKINNISELEKGFNVVFNCTGLSAKYLCEDRHIVPIQGQIITVHAPWIKFFYYADVDTFVVPLGDGNVALGTNRNFESYQEKPDEFITASIMKRCTQLVPSIAKAKVIKNWAGLRPYRHIVRLDIEEQFNLTIVHNYGHGGYGITAAPGTSKFVIQNFQMYHSCNSKM